ncbi:hypothetical protein [Flavobacterium panacagri]|uniref:hypothetical protein n=1 Tax=Flavobacterium panacagri TaxID=3034146 RepID=UPI0025A638B4|nr:hypothetical protein [Flavobacterium panacagri]
MKKLLFISAALSFFISCNNPKGESKKSTDTSGEEFHWNYPDENAVTKIINTNITIDDKDLISKLNTDFKKEKFKIDEVQTIKENSYPNCKENLILKFKGNGIKEYYVKRQEAKPKNYYPDFTMWIYEFKNEEETKIAEYEIQKAFNSGNGFCNGKSPEYIVRYKNKIIHLGTRAEMFRGYIKNYADKIEKLND